MHFFRCGTFAKLSGFLLAFSAVSSWGEQVPLQLNATSSSSKESIFSPDFRAFVEELRINASIPGISVGAVRFSGDGKTPQVELASWGRKTEEGDGHDLTPDTLFGLASCSKAFLATSVGLLMDDFTHGRNVTPLPAGVSHFDWDTKLAAILPDEWLLDDEWTTRAASIRDALGHVTGLSRHDFSYSAGDSAGDVVRRMRHLPTAYELREKWSYNNQMYGLGAYIIEKYANTSYPAFATERLFKPLKMSSTTFWPSEAHASGKLTHSWMHTGRRIPFWHTDDVNWVAVLLNKGVDPASGEAIIPRSVYDAVTTAQSIMYGYPTPRFGAGILGYGIGWLRWTYDGVEMINHDGGIPGFSTLVTFSPSSNFGVFILINADEQSEHAETIMRRAFDDVLNRTSFSAAYETPFVEKAHRPTVDVASEPLSLDLSAYTGTYKSSGYGSITLCSPISSSQYCADVLSVFSSLGPVSGPRSASLYGAYSSIWSTHARLSHHSHDTFNLTFSVVFPHGYGANTTAFEDYMVGFSQGRADFVVEGTEVTGFALVIDEDAVVARQQRTGGTLKETADAWFAKV
ncbi:hypothetical protein TRAPUB_12401 [Trametes pubescens]|uniref:Beta-lactamase-related domain-containing protein n=1 Tax=Trametes pubescens TaxID=154538 RepID=A0A1M2VU36_TRAPU|nr:hypothetical protein TRAPUB_12401 [Trametes pubescens]